MPNLNEWVLYPQYSFFLWLKGWATTLKWTQALDQLQIRPWARLPQQDKELAGKMRGIRVGEVGWVHMNSFHSWSWATTRVGLKVHTGRNNSLSQNNRKTGTLGKLKTAHLKQSHAGLIKAWRGSWGVMFLLTKQYNQKKKKKLRTWEEKVEQMPSAPLMHESRYLAIETTPETEVHWERALLYLETTLFK